MGEAWAAFQADVDAMLPDARGLRRLVQVLLFPRVRAVAYYRAGRALLLRDRRLLPVAYWLQARAVRATGADINPLADIAPGFNLVHPGGVVVGSQVTVGPGAWIYQGVTLGCGTIPGQPTIGARVHIGAGAKVLGGVLVGDDVRIGANAVVVQSVPDGATAIGVPAHDRMPAPRRPAE